MRIVIVNSFFPPWRGGAETYVYNLVQQLGRRGHEVTVLCGSAPLRMGKRYLNGVTVNRLRIVGRIYGTPVIPELPFRLASDNADIIHANFPSPFNAYFSSAISKLRKMPAVLTWHNDLPPVTHIAGLLVLAHDRLVSPLYLSQFRYIIATSETYAKTSPILSAQGRRVTVIPNGVDTQQFNPKLPGDEMRSRLNIGKNKIVLFVGALTRWHRYKGLDILMKAIRLSRDQEPQLRLVVVGGGELAPKYRQLADYLGIGDHIIFAGDVPDDELPKYYACSDVLVLPSKDRSEGFGLTILEANASGKPAIGTTVGGIPSIIQHGYNGLLVPPNNPEALAEAIRRAVSSEDLLREMGKNGRTLAEKHDWSIIAVQTENLYKRALSAP